MKKLLGILALALVALGIFLFIPHAGLTQHWLAVHTGTVNESGPYYGFWSGFGSDLGELTLIGGAIVAVKKFNCHEQGCWRLTEHKLEDPDTHIKYRQCHIHHPFIPSEQAHKWPWQNHFKHMDDVRSRAISAAKDS